MELVGILLLACAAALYGWLVVRAVRFERARARASTLPPDRGPVPLVRPQARSGRFSRGGDREPSTPER